MEKISLLVRISVNLTPSLIYLGSDAANSHEIFVWDVAAGGQYLKTMENGKEPLSDLDVRPHCDREGRRRLIPRSGTHTCPSG